MLDDQEPRGHHFHHQAECGYVARGAPNVEVVVVAPDPEVNARALHRGSDLGEGRGAKGNGGGETQGMPGAIRGDVGQGDGGGDALLAPEARPEGGVDEGLDGQFDGRFRQIVAAPLARASRWRAKCACTLGATLRAAG